MPRKQRFYYVYILSSLTGTLYTGITNSIYNRTLQHKGKENPGFTSKYDVNRLVYYEVFTNVRAAIRREKEIKGWTRKKKIALIESMNPEWKDLVEGWGEQLPHPSWQISEAWLRPGFSGFFGAKNRPLRMTRGWGVGNS